MCVCVCVCMHTYTYIYISIQITVVRCSPKLFLLLYSYQPTAPSAFSRHAPSNENMYFLNTGYKSASICILMW